MVAVAKFRLYHRDLDLHGVVFDSMPRKTMYDRLRGGYASLVGFK